MRLQFLILISLLLYCFSEKATTGRKRRPRPVTDSKNVTKSVKVSMPVNKTTSKSSSKENKPAKEVAAPNNCKESSRVCHKVSQRVNLGDVVPGSNLVIVSPKFVQVGLCVGSCSYRKHGNIAYKRTLRSLYLARKIASLSRRRDDFGGCVPTRFGRVEAEILVDETVVPYVFKNLTVEECGCMV